MRICALSTALMLLAGVTAGAAEIKYYPVPAGARPHDVAPAPDGTVWYTGQGAGHLGRLDPATGKVEIIPLGKGSRPHGVIVGPDGAAWVTDSGLNANVRVDPATRAVQVFPLPKEFPDANLNTGTFDKKGIYWFTGQNGVYGRVDPATGKTDAWKAPKGRGPYGIATTPKGDVWYVSLAGDHLAEIDPVSGEASVIDPPRPGVGPRRIWSDSKGMLWVSLWHSGEVGRYDPTTKTWQTWQINEARFGCYSVYVDDKDTVWLTDFASNAIVRFDPATGKFERFPSTRKDASVRQMLGRAGEVWGAESGTDRLVAIRY
ncbi:MAG: SMP-30/gluconolactonase/LRE family protein [Pseudorhodoplanes sp.]|nr:Virginiamycin B lyase [Pseudorhodoplanes sp.]MBW7947989.1 SMP-30/gluconolactonase/LRE family protein [Pseudorhodoplanes sp.]MCQ3942184.1 lyase [Alphaproteobacteria bacterium]GIK81674.1 MAG: hydrolase [Alphaproteobacteria bacterium]